MTTLALIIALAPVVIQGINEAITLTHDLVDWMGKGNAGATDDHQARALQILALNNEQQAFEALQAAIAASKK